MFGKYANPIMVHITVARRTPIYGTFVINVQVNGQRIVAPVGTITVGMIVGVVAVVINATNPITIQDTRAVNADLDTVHRAHSHSALLIAANHAVSHNHRATLINVLLTVANHAANPNPVTDL